MLKLLVLLLEIVVLIRVAVGELVNLDLSVGKLLDIGTWLLDINDPLATFMILSFFFLTSPTVRQSALARTGMRFTCTATYNYHY